MKTDQQQGSVLGFWMLLCLHGRRYGFDADSFLGVSARARAGPSGLAWSVNAIHTHASSVVCMIGPIICWIKLVLIFSPHRIYWMKDKIPKEKKTGVWQQQQRYRPGKLFFFYGAGGWWFYFLVFLATLDTSSESGDLYKGCLFSRRTRWGSNPRRQAGRWRKRCFVAKGPSYCCTHSCVCLSCFMIHVGLCEWVVECTRRSCKKVSGP